MFERANWLNNMLELNPRGFSSDKSFNQTLNVTPLFEDGLETHKVTSIVFVDLSAAYDTVNIRRLLILVQDLTNNIDLVNILRERLSFNRSKYPITASRWRL